MNKFTMMPWATVLRPSIIGAASAFDFSGGVIAKNRDVLLSDEAMRYVQKSQRLTFVAAISFVFVGMTMILSGFPAGLFIIILAPLAAPSLTMLSDAKERPSSARFAKHISAILALASLGTLISVVESEGLGFTTYFFFALMLGSSLKFSMARFIQSKE